MNYIETIEGNELIAEFMGVDTKFSDELYKDSRSVLRYLIDNKSKYDGLLFHSSWDWLMPVVEKIEHINAKSISSVVVVINGNTCLMFPYFNTLKTNSEFKVNEVDNTKILAVYKAVIKFITWYNSQSE